MADIALTASMRSNLLQLQGTTKLMDMTQERISTGKKINSALDGPVEFFTAKGLTDRATDFAALKDDMGQAISAIETASKSLESITDLVAQAKGLAVSAQAAETAAERANLAAQYDDLRTKINDLAGDATYNGVNLVNGRGEVSGGTWLVADEASADAFTGWGGLTVAHATSGASEQTIELTTQVQYASTTVNANAHGGGLYVGNTGASDTLDISVSTGWSEQAGAITATVSSDGTEVTFSTSSSAVTVTTAAIEAGTTATMGDLTLTLGITGAITSWTASGSMTVATLSTDMAETDSRIYAEYGADTTTFETGNLVRSIGGHTLTFASDAGATGGAAGESATIVITNPTGEGANDLTTKFNADGSAEIITVAQNASASGLGLSSAANSWSAGTDIEAAITQLDAARNELRDMTREFSTNLGVIQTREDFTNEFVNALQAGADKLTLADGNEEAANMLALQTRQQLGIQALSMASQSAQSVLSLFR